VNPEKSCDCTACRLEDAGRNVLILALVTAGAALIGIIFGLRTMRQAAQRREDADRMLQEGRRILQAATAARLVETNESPAAPPDPTVVTS